MSISPRQEHRSRAANELSRALGQPRAIQVVNHLADGLSQLRDLLSLRIHEDVEADFGMDSMISPMSLAEAARQASQGKVEIDVYSGIVAAEEIYSIAQTQWTAIDWGQDDLTRWLLHLRFGEHTEHLLDRWKAYYQSDSIEQRRLKFVGVLQQAVPESIRTPLVLFRLYPRCVRIAAALAWGSVGRAAKLRDQQVDLLPAIVDCPRCRGEVLPYDQRCDYCGNPVWNFRWLRAR